MILFDQIFFYSFWFFWQISPNQILSEVCCCFFKFRTNLRYEMLLLLLLLLSHFSCVRLCATPGPLNYLRSFLVAQTVKRLPKIRETRVWSLGQEDLLEKEMATHSTILTWKISWTEEPGRLQFMWLQRVGHDWETSFHFFHSIRLISTHAVVCTDRSFLCISE